MSLKFFKKLSRNFIELIKYKDDYNIFIQVENEEKTLTAHSNLPAYSLVFLLEQDDLQMNEIEIWDYVINWINKTTTYSIANVPYKCGTKDEFASQTF
ncbi:hypothetical protein Glove_109g239 [Diversispora epigaea]|uniref:BACK domain-containing protein n=1 Tax=Diversispora epigaea TaxID=1348612 RepID=A0A397JC88_9GLOM|nr:hypothetical protein Glove_109g239 [Diversispora epigaea]